MLKFRVSKSPTGKEREWKERTISFNVKLMRLQLTTSDFEKNKYMNFIGQYVLYICHRDVDGGWYRHPIRWSYDLDYLKDVSDWLLQDYYKDNKRFGVPIIVDYTGLRDHPHEPYNHVIIPGDLNSLDF